MDTREQLSPLSVALHWAIGLTMIGMVVFGLILEDMPRSDGKSALVQIHKSIGVIVLAFAAWRVTRRLMMGLPAHVGVYGTWEQRLAKGTHYFLLFATLALPLSGLLFSIGSARPVNVFGIPLIPQLLAVKNEMMVAVGKGAHAILGKLLLLALALHIAGALKHHFKDRDGTLRRMFGARVTPSDRPVV
jgi:cytochrome b561